MDAIEFLETQHKQTERLFNEIERVDEARKFILFETLSDMLAVHGTIEEKLFYPAVKNEQTMDLLKDSVQEHLQVKRMISDLMDDEPGENSTFAVKFERLRQEVMHHVEEERTELFTKVRQFCDARMLNELGQKLMQMSDKLLQAEDPSEQIPMETGAPAQI